MFLTRVAAAPDGLAQRANLEVLQLAHNHALMDYQARIEVAVHGGLAPPPHRHLLAACDAAP